MELLEGIETRRSFRAFRSVPVTKEIMERILKVASRSPSYTNTQPWEVAVVSGEKKEELRRILYEMAESNVTPKRDLAAPRVWPTELDRRAKEHGAMRFRVLGIERENEQQGKGLRLRNFEFYGAPCVLFLFMDSTLSSWSIFDIGLLAQSLVLAAHSLGVGSCLQAALADYPAVGEDF